MIDLVTIHVWVSLDDRLYCGEFSGIKSIMTTYKARFCLTLLTLLLLSACKQTTLDADLHFLDGKAGHYADYQGQWLLINYWAEWCAPCIKELPELNKLNAEHEDIQVLGIHFDRPAIEKQRELTKSLNIQFPVILAQPHIHYQFPLPQVLPATIVINPEGDLVHVLVGPQTAESLLEVIKPQFVPPATDDKASN